jgi:hypothetical protein
MHLWASGGVEGSWVGDVRREDGLAMSHGPQPSPQSSARPDSPNVSARDHSTRQRFGIGDDPGLAQVWISNFAACSISMYFHMSFEIEIILSGRITGSPDFRVD